MSTERDTERIVRSWLEDGRTTLPDWVRDGVLDLLPSTPQRRSRWPARRFANMNAYAKLAVGAAAVAIVAVVGFSFLPTTNTPGGPASTPSPHVSPTPSQAVSVLPSSGPLEAGAYRMGASPTINVTVPAGWEAHDEGTTIRKNVNGNAEVGFYLFDDSDLRVFADACVTDESHLPTGPTADDLLVALRDQTSSEVSEPVDVEVHSYFGTRIDLVPSAGVDLAGCRLPNSLQIWSNAANTGNYLAGGPEIGPIDIVETPTGRLVIGQSHGPSATAADLAELEGIVSSIVVEQ